MNPYLRQILLLPAFTLVGFGVYLLLFRAGALANVRILFYRGVALGFVAALVTGLTAIWVARRTGDPSLPIAAAALSLSFNLCFLVLFPVTVDRSMTVYLLATIERRDASGIDADGLQRAFVDGYVVDMRAIDRRIDEQVESGNIHVGADGKVRLTGQGRRFMAFSRIIARLFGTDPRFVDGDPDQNSGGKQGAGARPKPTHISVKS